MQIFEQSWVSKSERSKFYFESLLPRIAPRLGLEFRKERPFRIDGVFFKRASQSTEVPLIYVESENYAKSSHEEIFKLCCISAPLKVLFICNEWTEVDKREITDGYWQYIIDDFAEEKILIGNLCIIIAEWNDRLRFHTCCFNNKADLFEEKILAEL